MLPVAFGVKVFNKYWFLRSEEGVRNKVCWRALELILLPRAEEQVSQRVTRSERGLPVQDTRHRRAGRRKLYTRYPDYVAPVYGIGPESADQSGAG